MDNLETVQKLISERVSGVLFWGTPIVSLKIHDVWIEESSPFSPTVTFEIEYLKPDKRMKTGWKVVKRYITEDVEG